jgi:hypothetical protein
MKLNFIAGLKKCLSGTNTPGYFAAMTMTMVKRMLDLTPVWRPFLQLLHRGLPPEVND